MKTMLSIVWVIQQPTREKTRRNKKIQIIFVFENWFRSTFSLLVRFHSFFCVAIAAHHYYFFIMLSVPSPILRFYWIQETLEFDFRRHFVIMFPFRFVQSCGCIPYTWLNLLDRSVSKCNRYRQVRQVKTRKNCAHNDRCFYTCSFFVTWVMSSERNAPRNLNRNNWIFSNHNWNRCIYVWNVVREENPLLKFWPCFESIFFFVFSIILIHSEPIGNFFCQLKKCILFWNEWNIFIIKIDRLTEWMTIFVR